MAGMGPRGPCLERAKTANTPMWIAARTLQVERTQHPRGGSLERSHLDLRSMVRAGRGALRCCLQGAQKEPGLHSAQEITATFERDPECTEHLVYQKGSPAAGLWHNCIAPQMQVS